MPDLTKVHPIKGIEQITYIKNQITKPNIEVGEHSYYDDDTGKKFEDCVTHHYEFIGDKLIIGKYCQIAKGIEFVMNGANHQMNSVSTYPFFVFGWEDAIHDQAQMPFKGNTVVGNDVWIGQNSTVMPGVKISDGAIIATNSTVVSNVEPYAIYGGNPAKLIKYRFDADIIKLLLDIKWWEADDAIVKDNIGLITDSKLNNLQLLQKNLEL